MHCTLSKRGVFEGKLLYNVLVCHDILVFQDRLFRGEGPLRSVFLCLGDFTREDTLMIGWCCLYQYNREFVDLLLLCSVISNTLWRGCNLCLPIFVL